MRIIKRFPQLVLGLALIFTGISHLTTRRLEFQAQVPLQLLDIANFVVIGSGVVEIFLGVGLLVFWQFRIVIGWITASYLLAVSWGNISQFVNGLDAFGLNTGLDRFGRLLLQPLLIMWAISSTGAWKSRQKLNIN